MCPPRRQCRAGIAGGRLAAAKRRRRRFGGDDLRGQLEQAFQHVPGRGIGIEDGGSACLSRRRQSPGRRVRPADVDQHGVEHAHVGDGNSARIGLRQAVIEGNDDALANVVDEDGRQGGPCARHAPHEAAVDAFRGDLGDQAVADGVVSGACP